MTASLLDGKLVASSLKKTLQSTVREMKSNHIISPGLAVVLVGEDEASKIYVANKRRACLEVGFRSYHYDLPANSSERELLTLIQELNRSPEIDGILVQLPLPASIDSSHIIEQINPYKDVDGFHPYNIGRLALKNPLFRPCTPYGIIQLLDFYQIPLKGKHAVVVGASNIVGRPMGLELLLAGATVTICHRLTEDLKKHVRSADLLIVATGVCNIVDASWFSSDQVIIDVGIHRMPDGKLCGDVAFEEAKKEVAWITPVPGGVGPMTIISLLQNTLLASHYRSNRQIAF